MPLGQIIFESIKKIVLNFLDRFKINKRIGDLYRVSLHRNTFYLTLRSVVTAFFGFLFWVIAAQIYPVEIVGVASAAISAIYLMSRISSFGLSFGLMRSLQITGSNPSTLINTAFLACSIFSLVCSGAFLIGLNIWAPALLFLQKNLFYLLAFLLFTAGDNLSGLLDSAFIAKRRSEFCFFRSIIFNLVKVGMLVASVQYFTGFGIVASQGVGPVVAFVLGVVFFLPRSVNGYSIFSAINPGALRDMVHFSFANYIIEFLWAAPGLLLPIMVLNILGAEQNAYFYIGWTIASFLGAIGISASFSLFAEGSHAKQKLSKYTRSSLKSVLIMLIPLIFIIMVFAEKLLLLFGKSYSESSLHLIWILTPAALPLCINWLYIGKKRVQNDLKRVVIFSLLIAVCALGISYVLTPYIGILGVGFAWTLCQVAGSLFVIRAVLEKEPLESYFKS